MRATATDFGTVVEASPRAAAAVAPVHPIPTALARRFAQICQAAIAEALDGHDLTPPQYALLRHLDYEAGIYQSGLAARLGLDQSHASLLIEELVTMGLVGRRIDGADRRARLLDLTAPGRKLVRRLTPKSRAANERILTPLSPAEREVFVNLLVRVIEGNRVLDRPGAGRRKPGSSRSRPRSK
jgi:DNA-binding MarR family transcriptional regulator